MWSACSLSDDGAMSEAAAAEHQYEVPRVPASASALIFDGSGRLLILKPNYKKGWTIPGGQIDSNGESPWDACRRETREECGLEVVRGRLVWGEFRTPKPTPPGGLRVLFDCGPFADSALQAVRLQTEEIDDYRLVALDEASELLSGPIRRRGAGPVAAERCVYLEDGRPVAGVEQ